MLSSTADGSEDQDVDSRHVAGEITKRGRHHLTDLVEFTLNQLRNPVVSILFLSVLLALCLGSYSEATIILVILLLSAVPGGGQEYNARRDIRRLLSQSRHMVRVRRGGSLRIIPAEEPLPGDMLLFAAGDPVPADCRLLCTEHLFVVEGALTGEPFPVEKRLSLSHKPKLWQGVRRRFGPEHRFAVALERPSPFRPGSIRSLVNSESRSNAPRSKRPLPADLGGSPSRCRQSCQARSRQVRDAWPVSASSSSGFRWWKTLRQ